MRANFLLLLLLSVCLFQVRLAKDSQVDDPVTEESQVDDPLTEESQVDDPLTEDGQADDESEFEDYPEPDTFITTTKSTTTTKTSTTTTTSTSTKETTTTALLDDDALNKILDAEIYTTTTMPTTTPVTKEIPTTTPKKIERQKAADRFTKFSLIEKGILRDFEYQYQEHKRASKEIEFNRILILVLIVTVLCTIVAGIFKFLTH